MTGETADAVAVVGMAGRFPRSPTVEALWANLRAGVECISFFADEELAAAGVDLATLRRPDYVRAHGDLAEIETFDAAFFGLTPREAELLDPQKRLLLECAWEAMEHAGYDPARPPGPVGVFAGVSSASYLFSNLLANPGVLAAAGLDQVALASEKDFLVTLISYKLNLQGPSVNVQTACSTSLAAIHLACQSVLGYQCDVALAGGVSIKVPQVRGYFYQEGGIASPDGRCRAFDERAQGTVGGSGAGIVVLRRLEDALADGDRIWAVILGSAMNNDGSTKVGFTAPSVEGQSRVIAQALALAGVEPESVGYIEAHGTGTPLGDPIEMAALHRVFGRSAALRERCALGSVKTNIGHLDAAAGVAGFIKAVLALAHRQIPPSLHFAEPSSRIDWSGSPFYVNTALAEWRPAGPRRAGVSSFGIGGTNVHVVLEEAPAAPPPAPLAESWRLLLLSARTEPALERMTDRLAAHLRARPEQELADVAHTLQVGRHAFACRRAVLCRSSEEAAAVLEARDPERLWNGLPGPAAGAGTTPAAASAGERPVTFLLSGLGDHYPGMARGLYEAVPAFREELDRCLDAARALGLDLGPALLAPAAASVAAAAGGTQPGRPSLRRMLGRDAADSGRDDPLDRTFLAQPALFAVEVALARLLLRAGLRPDSLLGYSLGEYVAACLAGVFSLADALWVVAERARAIEELPPGAMLAVPLGEAEIAPHLTGNLGLAAVNGPDLAVVAGPPAEVAALEELLAARGLATHRPRVAHAFHCALMEPLRGRLTRLLEGVERQPPAVPLLSNVTGTWTRAEEAVDPAYWARHLCQTVRFGDAAGELLREPARVFVEVGPGASLSSLLLQHPAGGRGRVAVPTLRPAWDPQADEAFLLAGLGRLWLAGVEVDASFAGEPRRRRMVLPGYPFERQRYWIEPDRSSAAAAAPAARRGKNPDLAAWFYAPVWRESVLPPARAGEQAGPGAGEWLLFADRRGLGHALGEILARRAAVTTVEIGESFARIGDRAYALAPRRAEDYLALLDDLALRGRLPGRVVHLFSVTEEAPAGPPSPAVAEARQELGLLSLLGLTQALAARAVAGGLAITAVANGLHDVTGMERVSPEKATLLGPGLVIPRELPGVSCRCLDVVLPDGAGPQAVARLAAELAAELAAPAAEPVVACRGRKRWVQEFQPIRLEGGTEGAACIRPGGAYLITGGTGGIGLALAELLARQAGARLALLGRTGLPPRDEWDRRLAAGAKDATTRRIGKVRVIEEAAGEVMVLAAEVSDAGAMREALRQVRERFGPLNGVIHAAGVATGGLMALRTEEQVRETLAAKVTGTLVLAELLRGEPLDFILLCSSLSSILGGVGQADYCAANAFLDAFAVARAAAGGPPVLAVNWDTWKDVGMAVADEAPAAIRPLREHHLRHAISEAEGVEACRRILSQPLPRLAVSTQHLPSLIAWARRPDAAEQEPAAAAPAAAAAGRTGLRQAYAPPRNQIEETLQAIWQEVLGVERPGVHDPFLDLGGHSLLAMRVTAKVQQQYGVHLPLRAVLDSPTIARLAVAIVEEMARQVGGDEQAALIADLAGMSDEEADACLRAESQ
jgi:phthiocerol/phenolphthiocerol synthesis type-I polyketide synthase E